MANRDLVSKYGIKRSPTVKIFGRDKSNPVDYLGHRKQADVVTYCDEYCREHNYYTPAPVVVESKYVYNVNAIIEQIAVAHEKRVAEAETAHKEELERLRTQYNNDVNNVKEQYNQRLQDLISERASALQETDSTISSTVADVKKNHAANIARLDEEAINAIESVIAHNDANKDLTHYIPTLGYDWINIYWDATNRRNLDGSPAAAEGKAPADYNFGYGDAVAAPAQPTAPNGPYNQSDYYGAPVSPSDPYQQYVGVQTPQGPQAPSDYEQYGYGGQYEQQTQYGYQQPAAPQYGGYDQGYQYGGYQQPQQYQQGAW